MKSMDYQPASAGFTLIEMMIVIGIVAILATIAIPNFIAYRNKTFCTIAENDARNIVAAVTDYFSMAVHNHTPALTDLNGGKGYTLTGANTATISGADPNQGITISVTDRSKRCPIEYQNQAAGWDGLNVYVLRIEQ